jgi:hypothetical protein
VQDSLLEDLLELLRALVSLEREVLGFLSAVLVRHRRRALVSLELEVHRSVDL